MVISSYVIRKIKRRSNKYAFGKCWYVFWPEINNTVSVVAIALAVAIFIFSAFSGAKANKMRIIFAVCLATLIGWFSMPLAIKAASAMHMMNTQEGVVILITVMMLFVAAVTTSIYEIITITFTDIGISSKK